MRKIYTIILFLLLNSFILSSCAYTNSEYQKLNACANFGVPLIFNNDLKGRNMNILERDSYGRVLIEYTSQNHITDMEEAILIICQKNDVKYTYFYEDICYLLNCDGKEIKSFKELNDWKKTLDESKMSRRMVKITLDNFLVTNGERIEYFKLREIINSDFISFPKDGIDDLSFVDISPSSQEMYIMRFIDDEGKEKEYFVICDKNYKVSYLEIQNDIVDQEALREFKTANGWKYGF